MAYGFWRTLPRPFLALAPMHDVTDTVFRRIIARRGKPHVLFTEFISVDGLSHPASREKMVSRYLRFTEEERPLVAQIWGTDPRLFFQAARLLAARGFDGIDINMGCPERSAVRKGACAALVRTPRLAQDIIRAAQEGAGSVPVSAKIRLGYDQNVIAWWMETLLEVRPAAITVHGRTARQFSRVPADWDSIGRAAAVARGSGVLVVGNGDVQSVQEAEEKARQYGVDGVMIGRAALKNHWLFAGRMIEAVSAAEKLDAFVEHVLLFAEEYGGERGIWVLRKHVKTYTCGIPGAKELRERLMQAQSASEAVAVVRAWKKDVRGI